LRDSEIKGVVSMRFASVVFLACVAMGNIQAQSQQPVRFAVIGDYGYAGQPESEVAAMIASWNPDFLITTGDNNYDYGEAATIDRNIGQYFHQFISPYTGAYGQGDTINRMFPSLGNHDWVATDAQPYLDFFTLPGNERYYDHVIGNVHLFCIDSDPNEPDGISSTSVQGQWLQGALAASTARWKVVYFHHPPYSSASVHGSTPEMQWPFREWGATVVLSGHDHSYERIIHNGFPYFVNGSGGRSLYTFGIPVQGSEVRYSADYGAQLVTATDDSMVLAFYSRAGALIDRYVIGAAREYAVQSGWNMLSLPLTVPDARRSLLYPTATSSAMAYDAINGYVARDTVRSAEGFWLRFSSSQTVKISGLPHLQESFDVYPGWNLIGSIAKPITPDAIEQSPPGIIISRFILFDTQYRDADTLTPGKAYWVKVSQDGRLVLR
jgi:tartrate-resistant acid phosphatase type 5